jgi:hypothetical protein
MSTSAARRGRVVTALALACALPGCAGEYGNPFGGSDTTTEPSAAADIVFTSNLYAARPGAGREVYAVEDSGANPTRLSFCTEEGAACSTFEAAFSADRRRCIVRRVTSDANGDGRLSPADGQSLVLVDFSRSVQAEVLARTARPESADWALGGDVIVLSGGGVGQVDDLFRMDPNGQNNRNLTETGAIRERDPRIDPSSQVAVYERIEGTAPGQIWVFFTTQAQSRITSGGAAGPPLPGTPYVVGSDADPDYSPDGRSIVFRRLTAVGDGTGQWDIMAVSADGTGLRTVVSGPAYRESPDWGPGGIVFTERGADGRTAVVLVDPDGGNRRVLLTVATGYELGGTRWLP